MSQLAEELSSAASVYYSMIEPSGEGIMNESHDEIRIAEEIVSVLPAGVARALSADRETIRYAVRGLNLKLRTIVLRRASLRRLLEDPARWVKVDYLRRDLLRSAGRRREFSYPRLAPAPSASPAGRLATISLRLVSVV